MTQVNISKALDNAVCQQLTHVYNRGHLAERKVNRMKRRTIALAAAGAITALLGALLPQSVATAATGANCTLNTKLAQAQCDAVTMGVINRVSSFDVTRIATVSDYQINYPQQGLLWRFDENLIPRMDLLAKQDVSKDGKQIFQVLKPGITYSDNTPVTAQDVVAAFERMRARGTLANYLANVDSVVATSPTTVTWNLKAPWPDANWVFASPAMFLNPANRINDAAYWTKPVSAGPMKLVEWTPGSDRVVQQVNTNYWAKPKIQQITYVAIPDAATRKLALQSGQVDYVFDLGYQGVQDLDKKTIRWYAHALPGTYTLTINIAGNNPALKNVKNRQAISAAIDRSKVAKVAFFGTVLPSCAQTFIKGNPYHQCTLPNDGKQDLALAKKLLAEAGNPNGFTFDLVSWARPGWPEASLIIKEDLAKVGIIANVSVKDAGAAQADLNSGSYQVQFAGNNAPTPYLQLGGWLSPGGFYSRVTRVIESPETAATAAAANAAINAFGTALTPAAAKAALVKANQAAYEVSNNIPITDRAVVSATRLPANILTTTTPGEWLYVATTPLLSTQRGPAGTNVKR